jgi:hypothetical protein
MAHLICQISLQKIVHNSANCMHYSLPFASITCLGHLSLGDTMAQDSSQTVLNCIYIGKDVCESTCNGESGFWCLGWCDTSLNIARGSSQPVITMEMYLHWQRFYMKMTAMV